MESSRSTDARTRYDKDELTGAIRSGDEDGYCRQALLIVDKVLNRVRWTSRTKPHRDEIAQECLIECLAWFRAGNLDPDQNVSAYLWRGIYRKAVALIQECGDDCELYDESLEDLIYDEGLGDLVEEQRGSVDLKARLQDRVAIFGRLFGDREMEEGAGWVAGLLGETDYALVNGTQLGLQYYLQHGSDLPSLTVDRILYAVADLQRRVRCAFAEPEALPILSREAMQ
jgi:hypothetical protein